MKATEMLKKDHKKVEELLDRLVDQKGEVMKTLAEIEREIKVHSHIEEKIFYPAYREAIGDDEAAELIEESLEEHHLVDVIIHDMKGIEPDSAEFKGKASVLKEAIMHHANEEEEDMFPKAEKAMGKDQLEELGNRMEKSRNAYQPELEIEA
jgi:hemerythrin superfamily protein